jgi:hypothetical protein
MRRRLIVWMIFITLIVGWSCSNSPEQPKENKARAEKRIRQQADGTISLKLDNAECYSDKKNPASNTAEWDVVVSKSGRYNVWLSSATTDTTNLHYNNSVMLNILDHRIEGYPECDKVVHNSSEVKYPYFRADSFMGSLYLQDTGLYNIQVISEKILPKDYTADGTSSIEFSKLISVILTPTTR